MSHIEPFRVGLRSGREAWIRSAGPGDAAALLAMAIGIIEEQEFSLTAPEEFNRDPHHFERRVGETADHPDRIWLIAEAVESPGNIVGELSFNAGTRSRTAHMGRFGIAVVREWRDQGLGRALIVRLLHWAQSHPKIEKVQLGVFAENTRARALYRSLGFVEEGVRVRGIKHADGRYSDDVLMARFVKPV